MNTGHVCITVYIHVYIERGRVKRYIGCSLHQFTITQSTSHTAGQNKNGATGGMNASENSFIAIVHQEAGRIPMPKLLVGTKTSCLYLQNLCKSNIDTTPKWFTHPRPWGMPQNGWELGSHSAKQQSSPPACPFNGYIQCFLEEAYSHFWRCGPM